MRQTCKEWAIPWAQTGSILHQGPFETSSFVRNQILIWKVNNSLLRLSPWESQWKSLRGAFSAPVAIDPALSTKFRVRGTGSLAWAQSCLLAPSCTHSAGCLPFASPDHSTLLYSALCSKRLNSMDDYNRCPWPPASSWVQVVGIPSRKCRNYEEEVSEIYSFSSFPEGSLWARWKPHLLMGDLSP